MEAQQQAARNVARRWLGKLKHRRVQQAAQLWLTVWLEGESSQRDAAIEALGAAGATSTRVLPSDEQSAPAPPHLGASRGASEKDLSHAAAGCATVITALFPADHSLLIAGLEAMESLNAEGTLIYDAFPIMGGEWRSERDAIYAPVEVEDGFWVVPEWCSAPNPEALNVIIEPTYAVWPGKGTVDGVGHPATLLALRAVRSLVRGGEEVIDYGAGSGVIAIAALKLGAAHAVAVDIDPVCVCTAAKNMALNGIGSARYLMLCGGQLDRPDPVREKAGPSADGGVDICIANILEGDMMSLQDRLIAYTKPGGILVLSGMVASQVKVVSDCFGPFLDSVQITELSGWAMITGRRREDEHNAL